MDTRNRHNCTKEGEFEFVDIALTKDGTDKIKCKICGRVWQEIREFIIAE